MARLGRVVVAAYHPRNTFSTDLARALDVMKLRNPTRFRPGAMDCIINWGCTPETFPRSTEGFTFGQVGKLNLPERVSTAINKLQSLQAMTAAEVPCPEFTANVEVANGWKEAGHTVVCRHLLRGSRGNGIELVSGVSPLPRCPLYTKYVKKRAEFRVHVMYGPERPAADAEMPYEVIHIQQKRKRRGVEHNNQVRSWDNGWVFTVQNVVLPDVVRDAAIAAVRSLELHFGAVDVGYNERHNTACVYEVNTAPALEAGSLAKYADAFRVRLGL